MVSKQVSACAQAPGYTWRVSGSVSNSWRLSFPHVLAHLLCTRLVARATRGVLHPLRTRWRVGSRATARARPATRTAGVSFSNAATRSASAAVSCCSIVGVRCGGAAVGRASAAFVQGEGKEAVARVDDDVDEARLVRVRVEVGVRVGG